MRIAITGATGFVGRHLARSLVKNGHEVVLLARGVDERDPLARALPGARWIQASVTDREALLRAFAGCEAVAHCAGINREIGEQTYRAIHVEGTRNVVDAARQAGVSRIALMSFVRARPDCGIPYHESKWEAEEIVRGSGLTFTVLKAAMVYGRGDHMLDHLSHSLHTLPVFSPIGKDKPVRPVAVADAVRILEAALVEGRLDNRTVAVVGPEALPLSEVVRRVGAALGKRPLMLPMPVFFHKMLAVFFELTMLVPLVARSQVRMLAEGMEEALPFAEDLPADLAPRIRLDEASIRAGLPEPGRFGLRDLRCPCRRRHDVGATVAG
jgi:NADH dehydrogenase